MSTALLEQMSLFDTGIDVSHLRQVCEVYMSAAKSPNTQIAYAHACKMFGEWCLSAGREPLPASSETLSLFVASLLDSGLHVKTVRVRLAGISDLHVAQGHANPVGEEVRALVCNASRLLRQKSKPKSAVTVDMVRRVAALSSDGRAKDVRDRAMFLLLFSLGWRRSELASLDLVDVTLAPDRVTVHLGASKSDQVGKGRTAVLPAVKGRRVCPVRALAEWIDLRGRWRGPLFCSVNRAGTELTRKRISGQVICSATKDLLSLVGEADVSMIGAHSLRAGMATAAAEAGADPIAIMQRGGWNSMATVLRYIRPAQAFRNDPLRGVL